MEKLKKMTLRHFIKWHRNNGPRQSNHFETIFLLIFSSFLGVEAQHDGDQRGGVAEAGLHPVPACAGEDGGVDSGQWTWR